MNPEDLKRHLQGMAPGEVYFLPYDIYEGIFPPGEPDPASHEACASMARECGCTVAYDPDAQQVRFTRSA